MAETQNSSLPAKTSGSQPRKRPDGWWSIPGDKFQGSRAGVVAAIKAEQGVPDKWKKRIIEDINELDEKFNFVKVNAHLSGSKRADGNKEDSTVDYDIVSEIKL